LPDPPRMVQVAWRQGGEVAPEGRHPSLTQSVCRWGRDVLGKGRVQGDFERGFVMLTWRVVEWSPAAEVMCEHAAALRAAELKRSRSGDRSELPPIRHNGQCVVVGGSGASARGV
jgi:hypothetical protein